MSLDMQLPTWGGCGLDLAPAAPAVPPQITDSFGLQHRRGGGGGICQEPAGESQESGSSSPRSRMENYSVRNCLIPLDLTLGATLL